jgi:peptide/nickel transport system permease protein
MRRYVGARLVATVFTLVGLSVLVYLFLLAIPGSVVDSMLGVEAGGSREAVARLRAEFGLDRPLAVQYLDWLGNVVRGNLGTSWRTDRAVAEMIGERLPLTLQVALLAVVEALVVGVPLGVVAAVRRGTWLDHAARLTTLLGTGLPVYLSGTLVLLALSLTVRWIPPTGYVSLFEDPIRNLSVVVIPAMALGLASAAGIARMTRGALLDVLDQDYVRTARAKGLAAAVVINRHALRNALIPVITLAGLEAGQLLGGAVVTETIFSLPGVGRMLVDAIGQRDYPVVQGTVLVVAGLFILTNLLTDLLYAVLNPRVRYS